MMTILVIFSCALFVATIVLLYINWKIFKVTQALLSETVTIRKDTKVIRRDTRRVADSFDIPLPVSVPQTTKE